MSILSAKRGLNSLRELRPAWRWTAAALALAGLLTSTWLIQRAAQPPAAADPSATVYSDAAPAAQQMDTLLASLQTHLSAYPNDARGYALLGAAYLQKVRESGDPAYYTKADAVLHEALSRQPQDAETLTTLGVLALARHQFKDGLNYGQQALAINPYSPRALGVIFDGQTELGQYDAAVQTIQKMVDTRPDMSSYARVSYARELHGDVPGALQAMRLAAQAGSGQAENNAWTLTQVGNLLWQHGDASGAQTAYQAALQAMPSNIPAQAGLAKVQAANGDLTGAIARYQTIVSIMPLSEYVIGLGDSYLAGGQSAAALRQYKLVEVLAQLQQANGVDVELEISLFEADHPSQLEPLADTVAKARQVYARRPTIYAADALAWGLYQAGDSAEARAFSDRALSLKTEDALLWFHAGMIAQCVGDTATAQIDLAKALAINPKFSLLWAPVARQSLASLSAH